MGAAPSRLDLLVGNDARRLQQSGWLWVLAAFLQLAELASLSLIIATLLHDPSIGGISLYLFSYCMIALLRIVTEGLSIAWGSDASERIKARAREQLVEAISHISPLDRNRPHAGEISNLITAHVDALSPYLTRYRTARLRAAIVPIAVLMITACFSWLAAAILLVTGPLIPVFMALIGGQARIASERQLQKIGTMNAILLDRLRGVTTLRVFDAVSQTAAALLQEGEVIRNRTMEVLRIAFLSSAILELFAALGVAIAAVYVGFSLLGQFDIGAYGGLTIFGGIFVLMIAPEYFRPLREFAAAYHDQAAAQAASEEIEKIINGKWLQLPSKKSIAKAFSSLQLTGISVDLNEKRILQNLSISIVRGERIAIVGSSGSGKTILLAVIAGLIEPAYGTILINEKSNQSCEVAWLGQRPAFLRGSIAANISLYRDEIDSESLHNAVQIAQASEIVKKLDRGLQETLRENATNISGGEAQRLAIARLALSGAALILADEPTEHLDDRTAIAVINSLFELSTDRTLIVATHDPRVISRAHRVIDVSKFSVHARLDAAA